MKDSTRRKIKNGAMQLGWFVGTVAVSAAVLYYLVPVWLGMLILGVLIVHELAHFGTSQAQGHHAKLPFFIPYGIGITGMTHMPWLFKVTEVKDMKAARNAVAAGPFAGLLLCLIVGLASLMVGFTPGAWAALWLGLYQAYGVTLGSDGRKIRRINRGIKDQVAPAVSV
jgi:hypothetical protein